MPHARAATCHLSHSYLDGACLYFTFAATPPPDEIEATYVALWDAGQRAVLAAGGNLSHHHGVGLNRARFVAEALGSSLGVLQSVKDALDPNGILNPGKLGLPSPFGDGRLAVSTLDLERAARRRQRGARVRHPVLDRRAHRRRRTTAAPASASLLSLAALVGFVLGAGVAAWAQQLRLPLTHGIVCAVGTYVVAQAVFIVVRLRSAATRSTGSPRSSTSPPSPCAGLIGGGLGGVLHRRGFVPSVEPRGSS